MKVSALQSFANGVLYAFEQPNRIAHIEDERFVLSEDGSHQRIIKFSFGLAIFLMIASLIFIIILWYLTNNSGGNNMKTSIIYKKKKGLWYPILLKQQIFDFSVIAYPLLKLNDINNYISVNCIYLLSI